MPSLYPVARSCRYLGDCGLRIAGCLHACFPLWHEVPHLSFAPPRAGGFPPLAVSHPESRTLRSPGGDDRPDRISAAGVACAIMTAFGFAPLPAGSLPA